MLRQVRSVGHWIGGYAKQHARRLRRARREPRHLLFAFCDHYEPLWHGADRARGRARVDAWASEYPRLAGEFRDADGYAPRHSFFFPGEQYEREFLDALAGLAEKSLGEVELHLHHDGDTPESLRAKIRQYLDLFAAHGHLSRDKDGSPRYGFIHGNWCLSNARRDGRWCGVDEEIALLFETGCYADFTFPSAPDDCQPKIVNQIYWPIGDLRRRRAYERGHAARVGRRYDDRILMIQGPLALSRKPGSIRPRIENAAVTAHDPATSARVRTWVEQHVHVDGRPEWVFVKVHTHGAPETQAASLLGDGGRLLHRSLASLCERSNLLLHYVTAREMFNIALACMAGADGDPNDYRNAYLPPPPVLS